MPDNQLEAWSQALRALPGGTQEFAEQFGRFRLQTPWFHRLWYAAFDDPSKPRVYVQGPREHAKTSTILTYAKRRLAECQHVRVGIISGTDPLAKKFLNEVKYGMLADDLVATYNHGRSFVGDKWTEHELVMSCARLADPGDPRWGGIIDESGTVIRCPSPTCPGPISGKDVSVFSASRGSQVSSRHCDILLVDDPESADSVKSDVVRASTREWWSREVIPVLSPGGKLIAAGTRKHFDDLYSYWIAASLDPDNPTESWYILDQAKSVFLPDGEPIWPDMWSIPALLARKAELDAQDLLAWPQEYLNDPRPSGTQMLYPEKWPKYNAIPLGLTIYQCWDLAISEKTTADYTCGFTIGVDEHSNVFLLERRKGHWDFNRTLAEIADMGVKWSTNPLVSFAVIGIEQVAYQAAAVQEALRRTLLPIVPIEPDKGGRSDKVVRARLLEARAAANKVVRPETADWWIDFATEATFFPDGAHDDQVDSLSYAVRLAGWQSDVVGYTYGVWTCVRCAHKFLFEAKRPCPKCGLLAPAEFVNPEVVAFGMMGTDTAPGTSDVATLGFVHQPADIKPVAWPYPPADGQQGFTLTPRQFEVVSWIESGDGVNVDQRTYRGEVRSELQTVAAWYIDTGQAVKAQIALMEVRRLDNLYGVAF